MKVSTLENQLRAAMYRACHQLFGIYRSLLREHDLTYPQFLVLLALLEEENIPMSELGRRLHLGKSTMTPLIRRLEDKAFLKRIDGADERVKNVVLRSKGRALSQYVSKINNEAFNRTGLTESEAKTLIDLCHKMIR